MIVDWELPFRDGSRRLARRPLPESRRLGRHSDVALLLAVFLARAPMPIRGSRPGSYREAVLPDDGLSADGARRRRRARRRTTPMSSSSAIARTPTGRQFCEVVERWQYATAEEAKAAAAARRQASKRSGSHRGSPRSRCRRSPACVKVAPSSAIRRRRQNESPMVRIFEVSVSA